MQSELFFSSICFSTLFYFLVFYIHSPDMVEDKINYRKRELVYESIEHIQRFQGLFFFFL